MNAVINGMASEAREDVIHRVREEIARQGLTQSQVAREAGISISSLAQVLSGTYAADPTRVIQRLERWLARVKQHHEAPRLPETPPFVETPTAERIIAALGYAQIAADIVVVYGGAGTGKTTAAKEYARRFSSVWIATMSPAMAGVNPSLEEVCLALGFRELPSGAARMQREIAARVVGTGGLLIIDEAQHLSVAALDAIRWVHDQAGIGLALMGNDLIYARMTGTRSVFLDRLFSRIGRRLRLPRATKDDVTRLANANGIHDRAEIEFLCQIGQQAGALRQVTKVIRLARMMAASRQEELRLQHLRSAHADLTGVPA